MSSTKDRWQLLGVAIVVGVALVILGPFIFAALFVGGIPSLVVVVVVAVLGTLHNNRRRTP